jgi:hypothetical protein
MYISCIALGESRPIYVAFGRFGGVEVARAVKKVGGGYKHP